MPSGWPENDGVALNPNKPRALGVCDYCGQSWHLEQLLDQYQFGGFGQINLHFRVCPRCYDTPQEQLRAIVLPPDPIPARNPRIENYVQDNQLLGFTQNVLNPEQPNITYSQLIQYSQQAGWGLPQPTLTNISTVIPVAFQSYQIVPAGTYNYIMIYNPTNFQYGISLTSPASFTSPTTTTQVGAGTALLQNANASPPQIVSQGPIYAISTFANGPILIAVG
jgi:hypothetical protein